MNNNHMIALFLQHSEIAIANKVSLVYKAGYIAPLHCRPITGNQCMEVTFSLFAYSEVPLYVSLYHNIAVKLNITLYLVYIYHYSVYVVVLVFTSTSLINFCITTNNTIQLPVVNWFSKLTCQASRLQYVPIQTILPNL